MPTDAEIITEFARRESALGGVAKVGAATVCHDVAIALGTTFKHVRDVMVDEWAMGGS